MSPDLELRVYAPTPDVVIVRVSGTVTRGTAAVLAKRVGHQLTRAPHVVVDLGEVTAVDPAGLAVLLTLHQRASVNGTQIYLARAGHDAVRPALQTVGLAQLFTLAPTADAVIAGLPRRAPSHHGPHRSGTHQPDLDGYPAGKGSSRHPDLRKTHPS
jgi:anti-anti-sigma factor